MVKRVIVLVAVVLIMGLSLLAIQYDPGSRAPKESKQLPPGPLTELKIPFTGFR